MFTKISRYYKLADVVTPDRTGVKYASKQLRFIDALDARVEHTIDAQDRLDHLAYKYYKQSKQWWRICDANAGAASPLDMLGKSNQAEYVVDMNYTGYQAPWHLIAALADYHPGIVAVRFGYNEVAEPLRSVEQGALQFAAPLSMATELDGMTQTQQLSPTVQAQYAGHALAISSNLKIDKLGPGLWQIEDYDNQHITWLRQTENPPGPDIINVFLCAITHAWTLWVRYNGDLITTEVIDQFIEAHSGFDISSSQRLSKVGKKILIPNKYIG